ncbi:hypothetical protein HOD05_00170 [Candidatus Woesearchaeota archaeon]|jgi:nicotinic acid phosphoribosyltransferase|nr:hypothetical protein [Candidatus Woesearchaeota archaeon]MBT4150825.1 hypothetical protein [Candidatus Woesearchaeota archaeon]MBT4246930.1 hypothetical protein [Candidatus Woesearchaeota archaeon]MBT4433615.1 hypothetical protein [Candidatus Woesearchaeota archaeon]MBT7331797.1 hypothetical protein [Candidatus Woesearchaeota archaeon]
MNQLEKNTINSFNLVKVDISRLYEIITGLRSDVAYLRRSNLDLVAKVASLNTKRVTKISKKIITRKTKASFLASKTGSKFHSTKCAFAKNIKPKNKVRFASKNTALNKGLKRCACVA